MADVTVGSPDDENVFKKSRHFPLRPISSTPTNDREFISDSLYCSDSESKSDTHTGSEPAESGTSEPPGCSTPYKNIDVMMTHSSAVGVMAPWRSQKRARTHTGGGGGSEARTLKELPPLPSLYLYHPKNCPLHRGAPPRLSPIGALSPPRRPGAPPLAAAGSSGLSSPFFPRSHTLPALAAPLYYPNLYPPIPPRAPPLPPKLYQAPSQSHVASKIYTLFSTYISVSSCLPLTSALEHLCHDFLFKKRMFERSAGTLVVLCFTSQVT